MYVVYDLNNNIIAFNEDEEICKEYIKYVMVYNDDVELECAKLKKKSEYKLKGKDDLYLVCYGDSYIQSGYVIYMEIVSSQIKYDNEYALKVLKRVLETAELDKKEYKIIKKSIEIMDDICFEDSTYTPTIQYLNSIKNDYDPYIYNYKIGD